MSLIAGATARGRDAAVSLMLDQCIVGEVVRELDPNTADYVETIPNPAYTGICRLKADNVMARDYAQAKEYVAEQRLMLVVPVNGSEGIRMGHRVTITASQSDPGLVGRIYTVVTFVPASLATARRVAIEEVQA